MTDNKSNAAGASGLGTTLFLILLVLKLAGIGQVATWSWWWVTSPIWLPMALLIVMIVLYLIWKGIENILN